MVGNTKTVAYWIRLLHPLLARRALITLQPRVVVVHHQDFSIGVLRVPIRANPVVGQWRMSSRLCIWSFEKLDVFHIP